MDNDYNGVIRRRLTMDNDYKGVIRSRISMDNDYKGVIRSRISWTKKNNNTNNDSQNTTQRIKDSATRIPIKIEGDLMCSGRIGSSYFKQ